MGKLIEDLERDFIHSLDRNTRMLAAVYQLLQQSEADKVPSSWRPTYVNVHSADTIQILGNNHRRGSFSVYNVGPSSVLLSDAPFNGPTVATQYNAGNYNQVINVFVLPSGASQTLSTRGALYGYSLNYGTGSNENAVLQILETLFMGNPALNGQPTRLAGSDWMALNGHSLDADSDDLHKTLV